ncbi:MAG: ribosome biogenesis GTPase Der [Candidatus Doudnabacteria bacterium]|nr:ribosome biogenesis GTPase Der [Candidatus Doudnabacteria bacterium]
MSLPIVAIVGEPNAGKSTLLNKIAGKPLAVTSKVEGTTRDRQYMDTSWNGVDFTLVDTAGITFGNMQELESAITHQIDIAVQEADVLLFVVDGRREIETLDRKALLKFRKTKKPVILAVNKLDSPKQLLEKVEGFHALGIKNIYGVSSINGRGIGDLLDAVVDVLKKNPRETEPKPEGIAVSIVGKPNVGKSSLLNRILNEERVIVSTIPGTTRTAIDTHIKIKGEPYTFIDTAGLKRKSYRQTLPDIYSGFQTFKALRRSDIAILVIEANEDITKQDQHLAQEVLDMGKGLIIAANKMDLYDGDEQKLRDYISFHLPFLWMSPMFFISAKDNTGIDDLLESIKPIYINRHKEVVREDLEHLLTKVLKQNPPKLLRDQKKPKVFGLKQLATNPPMFELLVNYPAAISMQFRNAVKNRIVRDMELWGTPISLKIRGKDKS